MYCAQNGERLSLYVFTYENVMLMQLIIQAEIIDMCLPSLMVLGQQERRVFLLKTPEDSFCHYASSSFNRPWHLIKEAEHWYVRNQTGKHRTECKLNSNYECMRSFRLK